MHKSPQEQIKSATYDEILTASPIVPLRLSPSILVGEGRMSTRAMYVQDSTFLHGVEEKLAVIMVGMPARGKSSISTKLRRFLNWMGYKAEAFNVGQKRRELAQAHNWNQTSEFFDGDAAHIRLRDDVSMAVLEDLIAYLNDDGHVGIHDATNSTKARRAMLLERLRQEPDTTVLFVETICTDQALVEQNVQLKVKSPDYRHQDKDAALRDFRERLKYYEERYEPIEEEENGASSLKLINVGAKVLLNDIHGYLQSQIVMFLMNYHVCPRHIWVTRHGESMDNTRELLGGDSSLSSNGQRYARALAKFVKRKNSMSGIPIWSSNLVRTHETVAPLVRDHPHHAISALNEIYAGVCEGMTYEEIQSVMPEEFEARQQDKLRYRYPGGGESYLDIIARLKPLIIELERKRDSILAVLRCVIGYFLGVDLKELPHVAIPLHVLFRLTPAPFGCIQTKYVIDLGQFEQGKEKFWTKECKIFSKV